MKYIAKKVNGKKVDEHRLVMQENLGRELTKQEVVHHIDGNGINNDISNLILFPTKSLHTSYHAKKGDLSLWNGKNKKSFEKGKLRCSDCDILKDLDEFEKSNQHYFGIRGTCKDCRNKRRRK